MDEVEADPSTRGVTTAVTRGLRVVPAAVISLVLAVVLTVAAFPEVIFAHGSVTGVGMVSVVNGHHTPVGTHVLPTVTPRPVGSGSFDLGARAWQFEPTTKYMNEVLTHGRDPSWNPWQGSGELGPETLDGMQESPFVLAVAGLGGTALAFSAVALTFVVLALYCLQQLFVRTLEMSRIAGVGACVVFLLNGWMTAMFASVTCVPYLMFPVLLYVVAEYQRAPKPWRFAVAAATYTGLWVSTFPPGQFADILVVTSVAFVLDIARRWGDDPTRSTTARLTRAVGRQAVLPAIGLLGASFVLIPAVAALARSGDSMSAYSHFTIPTRQPLEWLGLLTPRHVYTTYDPATFPAGIPKGALTIYLGIAPLMLTAAAWPRTRGRSRWLLTTLVAITVLAVTQLMGVPGLKLIGQLPGLRTISANYWGGLAATALVLAFGLAIETARERGLSLSVALASAGLIIAALLAASRVTTHPATSFFATPGQSMITSHLVAAGVTVLLVVGLVLFGFWARERRALLAGLAVVLVTIELFTYQNHTRPRRISLLPPTPPYVAFLQRNVKGQRTLNVGRDALTPNWGEVAGIRQLETEDVMQIPWYRHFFQTYIDPSSAGQRFLRTGEAGTKTLAANPSALDLLAVKYLVVELGSHDFVESVVAAGYPRVLLDRKARVAVYQNPNAFPRAFLSPALTTGQRLSGPSPWTQSTTVTGDHELLDTAARDHIPTDAAVGTTSGSATIVQDDSTVVKVRVKADKPSILVLADTYHPNWTATIDGKPAHVGRVDSVVRGVVVPAGTSTVTFRYHSRARDIGEIVTGMTAVLVLAGCGYWAVRRRRKPTPDPSVSQATPAASG